MSDIGDMLGRAIAFYFIVIAVVAFMFGLGAMFLLWKILE